MSQIFILRNDVLFAPDCSLLAMIGETHGSFLMACERGDLIEAQNIYSREKIVLTFKNHCFIQVCKKGHLQVAKWLYTFEISDEYLDKAFNEAYEHNFVEIIKWLYDLNNMILVRNTKIICSELLYKLDFDDTTVKAMINILHNDNIPDMEPIPDIVVLTLFKFNRISELDRLSLPYVSYDVVDGNVVGVIKRMKSKSARANI